MNSFALYRLPHSERATLVVQEKGEPLELTSPADLNGRSGFVVAPFRADSRHPLLLIRPDLVVTERPQEFRKCATFPAFQHHLPEVSVSLSQSDCDTPTESRSRYRDSFDCFHRRLVAGDFRKVVLSRRQTVAHDGNVDPLSLFETACRHYPRLFVALVYTPLSGLWLTATPEVLLDNDGDDGRWHTIALAGTMTLEGDDLRGEGEQARWSAKNIEEQRLVATYIAEQLKPFAHDIQEQGPRTVRAANLVHLRSDFTFTLLNYARVGDLLQALHPTPAVCGLPKEDACRFITDHEPTARLYYSGFMGPLDLATHTALFVSLRCMQITDRHCRLYAGGGLLKDSSEEQEWQETEAKMETMRALLREKNQDV